MMIAFTTIEMLLNRSNFSDPYHLWLKARELQSYCVPVLNVRIINNGFLISKRRPNPNKIC
jgi:hypothetical protein